MKKYASLHPEFALRIDRETKDAKNQKKAAKTRMHQAFGAYFEANSVKKATAILTKTDEGIFSAEDAERVLRLHTSTRERLPHYEKFYSHVFSQTGETRCVLDLGCGFNPFSLPFFPWKIDEYRAIDVDLRLMSLLNMYFGMLRLPKLAGCMDLATETPTAKADVAFMLKLFPVLEASCPGRAYSLANGLLANWLAITFPTISLGGKKKGMFGNYRAAFLDALNSNALSNFGLVSETCFGNELLFVLKRKQIT